MTSWKSLNVKSSNDEEALSDRESGKYSNGNDKSVVLQHKNIAEMEWQHWKKCEKDRVKLQERITSISVTVGTSAKMAEVGVTSNEMVEKENGVTT